MLAAALPHRNLNILLLDISRFQPLCSAPQAPRLKPDLRAQMNCGESDGGRRCGFSHLSLKPLWRTGRHKPRKAGFVISLEMPLEHFSPEHAPGIAEGFNAAEKSLS